MRSNQVSYLHKIHFLIKNRIFRFHHLSLNKKLAILTVLISIIPILISLYFRFVDSGRLKIRIYKYKGEYLNVTEHKVVKANEATIYMVNTGREPVVIIQVFCEYMPRGGIKIWFSSEDSKKLLPGDFLSLKETKYGSELGYCDIDDSLGNRYKVWSAPLTVRLSYEWNRYRMYVHNFIYTYILNPY